MSSSISLLPAKLQENLQNIVKRTNQSGAAVRAILLSTTEGVSLCHRINEECHGVKLMQFLVLLQVPLGRVYDEPLNEEVLASIESVWAPASKQLPALGLQKIKQVTAIYDHGSVVNLYQGPLVRTHEIQSLATVCDVPFSLE